MKALTSYFEPLAAGVYSVRSKWSLSQIGRLIEVHTPTQFPEVKFAEIAVFNVSEYEGSRNTTTAESCKIRAAFYALHYAKPPRIVDLGMLRLMPSRKASFAKIEEVCKELLHNGIIPVILGGGHDVSYAVYKAYAALDKFISLSVVDKNFDIGLEEDNLASFSHLGKMISHKPSHLFHYTNLGYQSYFVSDMAVEMLNAMNFDAFRLGILKANFQQLEPIMRNTDFLSFDISALQYAYAAANVYSTPNGLNGDEACKIMRYAGLSDKLSAVGLFEYNQSLDKDGQTASLLAQMLWYFIDGYKMRKNELNPNLKNCIKYTVAFDDGKNEIIFYKSKSSGRWWMGVPVSFTDKKKEENYFVACSYQDYELANRGEVPERWIKTFNKFI